MATSYQVDIPVTGVGIIRITPGADSSVFHAVNLLDGSDNVLASGTLSAADTSKAFQELMSANNLRTQMLKA